MRYGRIHLSLPMAANSIAFWTTLCPAQRINDYQGCRVNAPITIEGERPV